MRADGVNAQIDRYTVAPVEGWPRWVINQLEVATFVLCICTPTYRIGFEGKNIKEKGLGVNSEGFIILQEIYDNNQRNEKYIPVLFNDGSSTDIPIALHAFMRYTLPIDYDKLFGQLTYQPTISQPPLGAIKMLKQEKINEPLDLPIISSSGFENQSEVTAWIRPDNYDLEQLAPGDGLYLSRIINPQITGRSDIVSTIWIAARGSFQYFPDSVRIKHVIYGIAGPVGAVAIPIDAEYKFTYHDGSDYEQALIPALSVGPQTRRYASFNLTTAVDSPLYKIGQLYIWINYHTDSGQFGTLLLSDPSSAGRKLAKLLGKDVRISYPEKDNSFDVDNIEQVITPQGIQKGFEEANEPILHYTPFNLLSGLDHIKNREGLLAARRKFLNILKSREALHKELELCNGYSTIMTWLDESSDPDVELVGNLLGGMATPAGTEILKDTLKSDPVNPAALLGLCIRHIITGDELLIAYALDNYDLLSKEWRRFDQFKVALALKPAGEWLKILLMNTFLDPPILLLFQEEMKPEDFDLLLAYPLGPFQRELYIRGTMNSWGYGEEMKLNYLKNGLYRATIRLEAIEHQFKISDMHWKAFSNCGAVNNNIALTLNKPFKIFVSESSGNIHFDLSRQNAGMFTFTLDTTDMSNVTLSVSINPEVNHK